MTKFLLIVPLFFFSFFCLSQNDTLIYDVNYNYVTYFDNGKVHEAGNFHDESNSLKHGEWILFDSTGVIIEKGIYKKGKKHGYWREGVIRIKYRKGKPIDKHFMERWL